jgi:aspartate aminotransferase-like enzyme
MESRDLTLALRERHGVTIAGGQGQLKNAIFRIGHIGWYDEFDIATALNAVELVLGELGAPIERGIAASRALEVYAEGTPV